MGFDKSPPLAGGWKGRTGPTERAYSGLECACRDDEGVCGKLFAVGKTGKEWSPGRPTQPFDTLSRFDIDTLECGVGFKVGGEFLSAGIAVGVALQSQAGQGAVAARRKERQRSVA